MGIKLRPRGRRRVSPNKGITEWVWNQQWTRHRYGMPVVEWKVSRSRSEAQIQTEQASSYLHHRNPWWETPEKGT